MKEIIRQDLAVPEGEIFLRSVVPTERIDRNFAQALKGPEQPLSASSGNKASILRTIRFWPFFRKDKKTLGNPVNPV
jgi:hypothetical protein